MLLTLIAGALFCLWLAIRVARLEDKLSRLDIPESSTPDPDARMKATGRKAWFGSPFKAVK